MRCERCQGLVVREHGESRCVNCGHRPEQIATPVPCRFQGCPNIPRFGTICSEHNSQIQRRKPMLREHLKLAIRKRWEKEWEDACE